MFPNYRYRLDIETEIRVGIEYAWCAQCADFVEMERLWTADDITHNRDNLLLLAPNATRVASTKLALNWRENRKSPPRCLSCESTFACTRIEPHVVTMHPNGNGEIRLSSDGMLGGVPEFNKPIFFNHDGKRLGNKDAT